MNFYHLIRNYGKRTPVEEATRWFVRISSEPIGHEANREFREWLQREDANETAVERCEYIAALTRELESDRDIRREINECRRLRESRRYEELSQIMDVSNRGRGSKYIVAIAVSVFLFVCGSLILATLPLGYTTDIGETKTISLKDGSTVILNTDTEIAVDYEKSQRLVHLRRGEAYFKVEHDKDRPFRVQAGNGSVTALGTAFDVVLDGNKVTVAVLEGSVAVETHNRIPDTNPERPARKELRVGESIHYWNEGILTDIKPADARRIKSWREGKLNFEDLRLADAVKEHNRYTKEKIILGSEEVKDISISGIFYIGDTDSFLYLLQESLGLKSIRRNNLIFLVRPSRSKMAEPEEEKLPGGSSG